MKTLGRTILFSLLIMVGVITTSCKSGKVNQGMVFGGPVVAPTSQNDSTNNTGNSGWNFNSENYVWESWLLIDTNSNANSSSK